MITRQLLRSLRNDLPMAVTIRHLGSQAPYSKCVEGHFRFQCPHCGETLASVNPRNNLAHCFGCRKNINNIDLLLAIGYNFRQAVERLEHWLRLYKREASGNAQASPALPPPRVNSSGAMRLAQILRQELGNDPPGS